MVLQVESTDSRAQSATRLLGLRRLCQRQQNIMLGRQHACLSASRSVASQLSFCRGHWGAYNMPLLIKQRFECLRPSRASTLLTTSVPCSRGAAWRSRAVLASLCQQWTTESCRAVAGAGHAENAQRVSRVARDGLVQVVSGLQCSDAGLLGPPASMSRTFAGVLESCIAATTKKGALPSSIAAMKERVILPSSAAMS